MNTLNFFKKASPGGVCTRGLVAAFFFRVLGTVVLVVHFVFHFGH